jgi:protein-S-isoprenylcysteine O-methyltransferase Ste14
MSLERKIPPPVVTVLCLALAWFIARVASGFAYPLPARLPIAIVLVLAGVGLAWTGLRAFRKARTTPDPRRPEKSTAIVRSGPYRFTRNPMYLGLAVVLLGVCAYLANPSALLAVAVFVGYLTRYQIIPEERALLAKFGETYAQYKMSVRRWI